MIKNFIILLLLLAGNIECVFAAQQSGGLPGYFLNQGIGVRGLGMGRACVSTSDNATSIYWNPSRLSAANYMYINAMYVNLFEETYYSSLAFVMPTGANLSYGASYVQLVSKGIIERNNLNEPGNKLTDSNSAITLGIAKEYSRFSLGTSIKRINKSFDNIKINAYSFDFGFNSVVWSDVAIGLNIQNLLSISKKKDKTTSRNSKEISPVRNLKIGASKSVIDSLLVAADLNFNAKADFKFNFGSEYVLEIMELETAIRIGYDQPHIVGGFGVKYDDFTLDYALLSHKLGLSHRISLNIQYGKSKSELVEIYQKKKQEKENTQKKNHANE
ncbi:MAG: hypothetical protein GY861_01515 [bacterium]|nr:hypothetical protein [bacterium]